MRSSFLSMKIHGKYSLSAWIAQWKNFFLFTLKKLYSSGLVKNILFCFLRAQISGCKTSILMTTESVFARFSLAGCFFKTGLELYQRILKTIWEQLSLFNRYTYFMNILLKSSHVINNVIGKPTTGVISC